MLQIRRLVLLAVISCSNIAICANNNNSIALNDLNQHYISSAILYCDDYNEELNMIQYSFNALNNITPEEYNQYPILGIWTNNNNQVPLNTLVSTCANWLIQGHNDLNNLRNNGFSIPRNKDIARTICYILEDILNKLKPLLQNPHTPNKLSASAIKFLTNTCGAVLAETTDKQLTLLEAANSDLEQITNILHQNGHMTVQQINNN